MNNRRRNFDKKRRYTKSNDKDYNENSYKRRNDDRKQSDKDDSRKYSKPLTEEKKDELRKKHYSKKKQLKHAKTNLPTDGMIRLNKYISNSGECSRRVADSMISAGKVKLNGKTITDVGTKVHYKDKVEVNGKQVFFEEKKYILLNKPKDYVTTSDDPEGRKIVLDLVKNACSERIYPVGRLDRATTGLLLLTNDGEMTKRLTHPRYEKKKIYHVFLDKPFLKVDFNKLKSGIELEDGFIQPDEISYVESDKKQVGVEIHSGKKHIVRRMFKHFGYQVVKLDRVYFAGLTKRNLPRGKWRFLTEEEIRMLKLF
ncbi:MAG: rRNA pseudouridine synthase [Marinifilaceae bacterium]|jgi:23S rRNA pseudouridine2605 synthase|nr:rRNA pseudouridine synthase [Marinifilaceae bacterium]